MLQAVNFGGSMEPRPGASTDLNTGAADANPMYMTVFNNALYFSANGNDGKGIELWKYDGTVTSRVSDINPDAGDSSPAYLAVFNNALYFSATSNDGAGTELWKYDGTTTTREQISILELGIQTRHFLRFSTIFCISVPTPMTASERNYGDSMGQQPPVPQTSTWAQPIRCPHT